MTATAAPRVDDRDPRSADRHRERNARRAPRAAFYGLVVDYWEIMLPVVALGPAMPYFLPDSLSPTTKATMTMMTFAAAFLGRPIGSVVFGHFADSLGRQRTTTLCAVGLTVSVLLVAFLPGYEQVGLWGLAGVLALRLLGGVFMGGQYTGANPLAMESVQKHQRGLVGGAIAAAWPVAYVAVSLVTSLLVALMPVGDSSSTYVVWGWRIPFVIGSALAFLLFLYLRKTEESPLFKEVASAPGATGAPAAKRKSPLVELLTGPHRRNLAQVFVMMTGIWFAIQILTVAPSGLLITFLEQDSKQVLWGLLLANVALAPCYLIFGVLGQRYGRRPTLIAAGVLLGVVGVPSLYAALKTINDGGSFTLAMAFFTVSLCLGVAPNALMIPYICERFPTSVRASGYGVGYTVAVIIPGFYSFMLIWLSNLLPYEYGTVVLLAVGALCMTVGAALGPETKDVDLQTAKVL
ncbi:MFS transporter [Alloalcanivorax gelatiniphagus]